MSLPNKRPTRVKIVTLGNFIIVVATVLALGVLTCRLEVSNAQVVGVGLLVMIVAGLVLNIDTGGDIIRQQEQEIARLRGLILNAHVLEAFRQWPDTEDHYWIAISQRDYEQLSGKPYQGQREREPMMLDAGKPNDDLAGRPARQARRIEELRRGMHVQVDKNGNLLVGEQPRMDAFGMDIVSAEAIPPHAAKISSKISEPAEATGGPVRSRPTRWFLERAAEVAALERRIAKFEFESGPWLVVRIGPLGFEYWDLRLVTDLAEIRTDGEGQVLVFVLRTFDMSAAFLEAWKTGEAVERLAMEIRKLRKDSESWS